MWSNKQKTEKKKKEGGREGEVTENGEKAKRKGRIPRCKKEIETKMSAGC